MRQNTKYPKITVKHTAQNWRLCRQCPQVELKIFLEHKDCEVHCKNRPVMVTILKGYNQLQKVILT